MNNVIGRNRIRVRHHVHIQGMIVHAQEKRHFTMIHKSVYVCPYVCFFAANSYIIRSWATKLGMQVHLIHLKVVIYIRYSDVIILPNNQLTTGWNDLFLAFLKLQQLIKGFYSFSFTTITHPQNLSYVWYTTIPSGSMTTILQITKITFLAFNAQQSTIPHEIILLFSIHNISISFISTKVELHMIYYHHVA